MKSKRGQSAKQTVRAKLSIPVPNQTSGVGDMYANPQANIGWGSTSNVNGGRHIPFRISLDYQRLVMMYRGSWVIRAVVDTKPQDQLKSFPSVTSADVSAEDISDLSRVIAKTMTLQKTIEAAKWGRLFGGALGIIILAGQNDLSKPLKLEDVQPDSYRGLIVVDRWSGMSPSSDLIDDITSPEYGLPVYYNVYTEASQTFKVHHSRCLRFLGRELPLFEKQIETYWGMSEIECILDELQRYDFCMAGVADLISRAHVIGMKEPMLAQMLSGVSLTEQQYMDYVMRMKAVSESISTNGVLAVGEEGEIFTQSYSFGGLRDVAMMFTTTLLGAAGYPMSRIFGQTNSGLGDSGEGDLQHYYDGADQERNHKYRPIFDKLLPIICMSTWGEVPDDLDYQFAPLRTMNSKERAQLAKDYTEPILASVNAGIITPQIAAMELAATSGETGIYHSVTPEFVATLSNEVQAGDMPQDEDEKETESVTGEDGAKDGDIPLMRRLLAKMGYGK